MKKFLPAHLKPGQSLVIGILTLTFFFFLFSFHSTAYQSPTPKQQELSEYSLEDDLITLNTTILQQKEDTVTAKLKPFPFNPNTASEQDLRRMGLPENVITTILRFRSKGGTFRRVEELGRIYGMTDAALEKLRAYVRF